jgi:hypothetical protein
MSPELSTNETRPMTTATAIAQSLVRRERARGSSAEMARAWLAGKLKVGMGTTRNLVRGRVKRVDDTIRERLRALLMRELEAEIARLQHELESLKRSGAHLASQQISEVEAHIQAAKAILTGGVHAP